MEFYKKLPFSMTEHQIEKHIHVHEKKTRAYGETSNNINMKFSEILNKTE